MAGRVAYFARGLRAPNGPPAQRRPARGLAAGFEGPAPGPVGVALRCAGLRRAANKQSARGRQTERVRRFGAAQSPPEASLGRRALRRRAASEARHCRGPASGRLSGGRRRWPLLTRPTCGGPARPPQVASRPGRRCLGRQFNLALVKASGRRQPRRAGRKSVPIVDAKFSRRDKCRLLMAAARDALGANLRPLDTSDARHRLSAKWRHSAPARLPEACRAPATCLGRRSRSQAAICGPRAGSRRAPPNRKGALARPAPNPEQPDWPTKAVGAA